MNNDNIDIGYFENEYGLEKGATVWLGYYSYKNGYCYCYNGERIKRISEKCFTAAYEYHYNI